MTQTDETRRRPRPKVARGCIVANLQRWTEFVENPGDEYTARKGGRLWARDDSRAPLHAKPSLLLRVMAGPESPAPCALFLSTHKSFRRISLNPNLNQVAARHTKCSTAANAQDA